MCSLKSDECIPDLKVAQLMKLLGISIMPICLAAKILHKHRLATENSLQENVRKDLQQSEGFKIKKRHPFTFSH